jgi:nucleoside-diphosphate-sugar epimerase
MRIALTGATGGVGTTLALSARARGDEVAALVRDPGRAATLAKAGVRLVTGDLDSVSALDGIARGADVFVHAAAHVGDWGRREEFERVNVDGTRRALEAAARAKVKRFVHVSSVAVYGRPDEGHIDETYPARPYGTPYEDTKYEAERMVFERGPALGLEVAAVRPPVIFGEHDRVFVPRVVRLLAKKRVVYINHATAPFNIVDAADVVDVVLRCMEHPAASGEAFNVAASPPPRLRDVVETIAHELSLPLPRFSLPKRPAMILAKILERVFELARSKTPPPLTPFIVTVATRHVVYDAAKARTLLGWHGGKNVLDALRAAARVHASAAR